MDQEIRFYIERAGNVAGPITDDALRDALRDGRLEAGTRVRLAGIENLDTSLGHARVSLDRAERLGMDVERPTYELTAAGEALVRARVVVHAHSEKEFATVIEEGTSVAGEVEKAALAKLGEYGFRRKGLAVASAMLLLFAGLLALKARRLETDRLRKEG